MFFFINNININNNKEKLNFHLLSQMESHRVIIKNTDMTEKMQKDVIAYSIQAIEKFTIEKDIAMFLKKEFDKKHGPAQFGIAWLAEIRVDIFRKPSHLYTYT